MKLFIFGEIKVKYENSAYPADCVKCFSYSSCYNFHAVSEFQSTEFINLVFSVLKFVFKLYVFLIPVVPKEVTCNFCGLLPLASSGGSRIFPRGCANFQSGIILQKTV